MNDGGRYSKVRVVIKTTDLLRFSIFSFCFLVSNCSRKDNVLARSWAVVWAR